MPPSFDEMRISGSEVRDHYRTYERWLQAQPQELMRDRRDEAEMIFRRVGITFAVYGAKDEDGSGTERLIPFDLIPRVIPSHEWSDMEKGLRQRVTALNRFLHDVYHDQEILKAGLVPAEQVLNNAQYRPEMRGVNVPGGVYSHISGVDIVRAANADGSGSYYVLEDNLRVPSGVSYMLEDRKMMMRLFPELFAMHRVAPVAHYPDLLLETLRAVAPAGVDRPHGGGADAGHVQQRLLRACLPGAADGRGAGRGPGPVRARRPCVHAHHAGPEAGGRDLPPRRRRLPRPQVFRKDSTLGCAGMLGVYRSGNITLANAIGTGVADDKSIYPYVPKMIEFYLGEKPILNNVPTYLCRDAKDLSYVLAHLDELVVKEVHGAGGYGMLVGPAASKAEIEEFRAHLLANPSNYIAQPTLEPVHLPDLRRSRHRAAPHRPAALRAVGHRGADGAGRPDARGAEGRLAGGEFVAGRRHQGHLGAGRLNPPEAPSALPPGGDARGPAKPVPRRPLDCVASLEMHHAF